MSLAEIALTRLQTTPVCMDEATSKHIIYNHGLPLNLPMGSSQQDPARPSVATKR
jgi:hypothetical protein